MKYKGIELNEFTSDKPVVFDPPKRMLVWDDDDSEPSKDNVFAFIPNRCYPVIGTDDNLDHCAEIPEELKNHVTRRELARWLAQGNGEVNDGNVVYSDWDYFVENENEAINNGLVVRTWDDTEWHKPTREYLGLED